MVYMPNQQVTHIDFGSGVAAPAASFAIVRRVSIMTRQEIRSALRKVSPLALDRALGSLFREKSATV